jgi:hypothetical protein
MDLEMHCPDCRFQLTASPPLSGGLVLSQFSPCFPSSLLYILGVHVCVINLSHRRQYLSENSALKGADL